MVDTLQPRGLSCFKNRKRRHDNEMNLEKEKGPTASQHDMGWNASRIFRLLPVAGEIVLLTFPFIERRKRPLDFGTGATYRFPDFPGTDATFGVESPDMRGFPSGVLALFIFVPSVFALQVHALQ